MEKEVVFTHFRQEKMHLKSHPCYFLGPRGPLGTPLSTRPPVRKKNLDQLYSIINHPRIMPDNAYEILMERGQYLLSFGDDEYKDKDKYKYKIHKYSIWQIA